MKETRRCIAILASAFRPGEFTPERLAVYERCLEDIEPAALEAAIVRLIQTAKFVPNVAEIRAEATRSPDLHALEAWGMVVEAARKREGRVVDKYGVVLNEGHPPSLGPRVDACIKAIGGWKYLLSSDNDMSDRARFCDVFDALDSRETRQRQTGETVELPLLDKPS